MILPDSRAHVSYADLCRQVMHVAGIFAGAGIGPEDRVAMSLPNGLEAIVCVLAAAVAGTAAPLNPNYRHEEVCFYLEDTSAKLLVLPPEGAAEARLGAAACGVPVIVARRAGAEVEIEPQTSGKAAPPDGDRVAFVLHTSGSTGRPKRVPLRHRNVTASARHIAGAYELSPDDIAIAVMPLFHVHGLIASVLATFASGGTVVELPRFNPLSFWHTVRDHRATWYSAVPAIHQVLLTRARGRRPAETESLRFIRSASAPLPAATLRELEKIFEIPVVEAYGMTEAAHQIASNRLPADERKLGSVGKGTGVRIGILDSEGALLGAGEPGEVVIQGPNVIDGYENNPDANADAFVESWFRTGDQGVIDNDGFLFLLARIKEMINFGGEKISPPEIDHVLLTHPSVEEAVCFAKPHPVWGEEVAAAIVLKQPASDADIVHFCKEHLAEFKIPKQFFFVQSIPRTATGKIQRQAVAAALLGEPQ